MRRRELQKFKKFLLEEQERLVEKLGGAVLEDFMEQSNEPADEADASSSIIDQSLTIRLLSRESRLLNKIEKALNKIECGSFGTCEICGEEIDLKRLQTRPIADLCIKCKEDQERKEMNILHSHE